MTLYNPILIDEPNVVLRGNGLLQTATVLPMPDEHFRNGVLFRTPDCGNVLQFIDLCSTDGTTPAVSPKVPTKPNPGTTHGVGPWNLYSYINCRGFGDGSIAAMFPEAVQSLERGTPQAVETAFWTDALVSHAGTHLINIDQTIGNALCIVGGVAALESYMGSVYAGEIVLHADRGLAAYLRRDHQLLGNVGDTLESILGSKWAFYGGATGDGPGGTAPNPGYAWIYATSDVTIWHSEVDVNPKEESQVFRYGPTLTTGPINEPTVIAEQTWVAETFCAIAAVQVQLTC